MLTNYLAFLFLDRVSYILTKYSDFPKMKNFSDLGYNRKMVKILVVLILLSGCYNSYPCVDDSVLRVDGETVKSGCYKV